MYNEFFGFREPPFRITPDPRFLYRNPCYDEACAALTYGLEQRKGFLSLVGEAGTGKTTLLRHLLETSAPSTKTILLLHPTVSFDEILEYILLELGVPVEGARKLTLLTRLNEFLLDHTASGGNVALLIDEAQDLEDKTLEELRLLSNLETGSEKILQILIAGQPELEEKLAMPQLRQLRQRIAMHVRLRPLSPPEVASYVCTRLQHAGSNDLELFSTDALMRIAELTGGIPRIVNVLCDACLVTTFASGVKHVTPEIVDEAWADYARLTPERAVVAPPSRAASAVAPTVPPVTLPSPAPSAVPPAELPPPPAEMPASAAMQSATSMSAGSAPPTRSVRKASSAKTRTAAPAAREAALDAAPPSASAVPTPDPAWSTADPAASTPDPDATPAPPPPISSLPPPAVPPPVTRVGATSPPLGPNVQPPPPPAAAVAAATTSAPSPPPPVAPAPPEATPAEPPSSVDLVASYAAAAAERAESFEGARHRSQPNLLLPMVAVGLIVGAVGLYAVAWRNQHLPPELTFGEPGPHAVEPPGDVTAAAPTTPPTVAPLEDVGPPPPPVDVMPEPAAQAQVPTIVPDPPAVAANGVPSVEAAREIVDAYVEAYEARDVDALVALFASDARQNGRVGREMIGAEYRRAFSQLATARYDIEDLEVEERDSSLILRGPFQIAYRYVSGQSGTMEGTASWEISTRDGEPRIVTFDYDLG